MPAQNHTNQWKTSLCCCCSADDDKARDDCVTCGVAIFVPCIPYAQNLSTMKTNGIDSWLKPIFGTQIIVPAAIHGVAFWTAAIGANVAVNSNPVSGLGIIPVFMQTYTRRDIRDAYKIQACCGDSACCCYGGCEDFCASSFCYCCALAQEAIQLRQPLPKDAAPPIEPQTANSMKAIMPTIEHTDIKTR